MLSIVILWLYYITNMIISQMRGFSTLWNLSRIKEVYMDKRVAKVLWSKSGAKSDITRITLPVSWIRDMGLTKEIREMDIEYDQEKKIITLRKKDVNSEF